MSITLQEASTRSGVAYALLKKHAQRGKLRTSKDGPRLLVEEADLDAYLAAEKLGRTAAAVEGQPVAVIAREFGNAIASLPSHVQAAILEGMPTQKSPGGSSAPFKKAVEGIPKRVAAPDVPEDVDPHRGFAVGHQHRHAPRWKRTSSSTWSLDGASWSWNGMFWEGGGSRDGQTLAVGISPAAPMADYRPIQPSKAVKVEGKHGSHS